jgi:glycosyltransferase involved in cell wall biosynthesis
MLKQLFASKKPLITVITVVLNGEKFLEQTIQSVVNQTYDNLEYIVVDGNSKDETLNIIKKYEQSIDYWISEKDSGIYEAMNKGIALSSGDWISFINADDFLWNQHVMEKVVMQLTRIPLDIRVVYAKIMLLTIAGKNLYEVGEPWDKVKKRFEQAMSISHPGVLHRRSLFEEHGQFDESFRIAGDYELLLRELKSGEAKFIPEIILTGVRQGGVSNLPEQTLNSLSEVRRAQRLNGLRNPSFSWLIAVIRVHIRSLLWWLLGEKTARKMLDLGRRLIGLKEVWSVAKDL